MNNVGCTPWVSSVQRWVTPSGPGPSVHRIRSYRIRSHEYAFEHAHLHPADRQRRFGTQVVSKSSVPWSTRGSPGMHPQHASRVIRFLRGGMEVGMEHMPKPDRHESIMTAALGRPARRPRASFLTGRLPIAHTPTVPASGGWTPVRVAGGADTVGGVQGPANE